MKITRSDGERLVIVDFPYVLGSVLFGAAVLLLGHALIKCPLTTNDLIGHGVGIFGLLAAGALFTKRSEFNFDLNRRQLIWSRYSMFGRKGGTVPFSDIQAIQLQPSGGAEDSISFRLSLSTTHGLLPLTDHFTGDSKTFRPFSEAISRILGLPIVEPTPEDMIRYLIAEGKIVSAIQLVRLQRNCSLAEAKQIVETLR